MGKDGKRDVLNITVNVEAIANAARNAANLDDLALEINTVNPRKITLEQEIYTLKSVPANDNAKGKKKEFGPRVVGIKSIVVTSLSTTVKEDHITINGTLDVPKSGHRVVKLEECLFETEDDARAVARILTEIELEKATTIRDDAQEAVDMIKKQLESDTF
jgi:hypothetical protein